MIEIPTDAVVWLALALSSACVAARRHRRPALLSEVFKLGMPAPDKPGGKFLAGTALPGGRAGAELDPQWRLSRWRETTANGLGFGMSAARCDLRPGRIGKKRSSCKRMGPADANP